VSACWAVAISVPELLAGGRTTGHGQGVLRHPCHVRRLSTGSTWRGLSREIMRHAVDCPCPRCGYPVWTIWLAIAGGRL
jgi:hypothetical protein